MGISAANPGRNDLAEGPSFLKDLSKKPGVPYVSANLRDAGGALLFPPSKTFPWGVRRAVVFGLTKPSPSFDAELGFKVDDPIAAAKALAATSEADDILICLTDIGYTAEHELARQVGRINLIVGGGEGTQTLQSPIPIGSTLLLRAADKGRVLGALSLSLPAKGWPKPVNSASHSISASGLAAMRADSQARGFILDPKLMAELESGVKRIETPPESIYTNEIKLLDQSVADEPRTLKAVNAFTAKWAAMPKPTPPQVPRQSPKPAPVPRPKAQFPSTGPDSDGTSISCKPCHGEAYRRWAATRHSSTLARLPGKERVNPSCQECHMAKVDMGVRMVGEPYVGCQACHGPGAGHPGNRKVRRTVEEGVCARCHRNEHGKGAFDYGKGLGAVRCDQN